MKGGRREAPGIWESTSRREGRKHGKQQRTRVQEVHRYIWDYFLIPCSKGRIQTILVITPSIY